VRYAYASVALPTLTPEQTIAQIVAAGYEGVSGRSATHHMRLAALPRAFLVDNRCTIAVSVAAAARVYEQCRDAGLAIVGLGPLPIGDMSMLRTLLARAQAAHAPQTRLQAARLTADNEAYSSRLQRNLAYLDAAEPLAREAGVRIAIEMHQNTIAPSASLAMKLVDRFDPNVIGVIYDVGNLIFEGYENARSALELLGPYLAHVHLKNAAARRVEDDPTAQPRWLYAWSALEDGLVDMPQILELLHSRDYDGPTTPPEVAARHQHSAAACNEQVARQMFRQVNLSPGSWHIRSATDAFLCRLQVPVLAIYRNDERASAGRAMRAGVDDRVLVYADTGHWPHQEQPDRFQADVTDWLASLRTSHKPHPDVTQVQLRKMSAHIAFDDEPSVTAR